MVRPSYVLGGRAMEIVHDESGLEKFVLTAMEASRRESLKSRADEKEAPILIDQFLPDAIEVDVDVVADGTDVVVGGVMEHIEEAGIHSGDSACCLPPHSLPPETVEAIKTQARALARELGVRGLMNVQFAVPRDGRGIFILEVNPRASRTVPFVSKVTGVPLAKVAARIAVGRTLQGDGHPRGDAPHIAVKEAVFPFAKFAGVDTILGPEMRSTGEVMGIDTSFAAAFGKSQIGAGTRLPMRGTAFISVQNSDKAERRRRRQGARRPRLRGARHRGARTSSSSRPGIDVERINKVREGRPHCVDRILDGGIHLVINTTAGAEAIKDSFPIRRNALLKGIPYYTTMSAARAAVGAIAELRAGKMRVRSLQEYQGGFVAMAKFPMTPRGQQALRDELKRLREVERPKNVLDIEEARAHGDLQGERRVPRRQGEPGLHRGALARHRVHSCAGRGDRPDQAVRQQGGVRRHGEADRHRQRRRGDLHGRRRPRGRHQGRAHRHLRAAGARHDRPRAGRVRSR